jgi:hypothetical protein
MEHKVQFLHYILQECPFSGRYSEILEFRTIKLYRSLGKLISSIPEGNCGS